MLLRTVAVLRDDVLRRSVLVKLCSTRGGEWNVARAREPSAGAAWLIGQGKKLQPKRLSNSEPLHTHTHK